jgi:hypothetical protein
MIPSLESSTHINFSATAQFIEPYFADSPCDAPPSLSLREAQPDENPYWREARDRTAKTVRFAHFLKPYADLRSVVNVRLFVRQVIRFRRFAKRGLSALKPSADTGLTIALGKCFAIIAYGQLVAESCSAAKIPPATVAVIFHALIEDLSAEALKLSALFVFGGAPRRLLKRVIRVPRTSAADLGSVSEFIAARYAT